MLIKRYTIYSMLVSHNPMGFTTIQFIVLVLVLVLVALALVLVLVIVLVLVLVPVLAAMCAAYHPLGTGGIVDLFLPQGRANCTL